MIRAYCWPSGLIVFSPRNPGRALIIARGPDKELREFISARARLAYPRRSIGGARAGAPGTVELLVPGVPEADSQSAAQAAFDRWTSWIATAAPKGVHVLTNKGGAR